jgi:hypothetical protein
MGYNGGPHFTFSEGLSLYVDCEDQNEVDEYWDKLVRAGAKPNGVRLDQGPVRSLLADRPEAIHRAHPPTMTPGRSRP